MKIALIGYMASGKSFWGKMLANSLEIKHIDLDTLLEVSYLQSSISHFILDKGELAFRKIERQALLDLAANTTDFVLSTGGGTPCYYANMTVLNKHFRTVYLDCPIAVLTQRLIVDRAHRPLISHLAENEVKEFVAKHLFERRAFYHEAHVIVKTEGLTLHKLIEAIKNE